MYFIFYYDKFATMKIYWKQKVMIEQKEKKTNHEPKLNRVSIFDVLSIEIGTSATPTHVTLTEYVI